MKALENTFQAHSLLRVGLMLVTLTTTVDALAQSRGTVAREHWPDLLYETQPGAMDVPGVTIAENLRDVEVLPFVDSLSLDYVSGPPDETARLDLILRWVSGPGGILDGAWVDAMPDSVAMTLVDLQAEVWVRNERVGDLVVTLDSLWLPASPYQFEFTVMDSWENIFRGLEAGAARSAFEAGFELRNLDILRAAFEAPPVVEQATASRDVPVVRRPPRRESIFVPDTRIWIGWNIGPDPYRRDPRVRSGTVRPRGDDMGRTTREDGRSTREEDRGARGGQRTSSDAGESRGSSDRSGGKSRFPFPVSDSDNDEDDNDRDLAAPALGAVAAIGALAYFGGTVGYYGYPADAPLGLQAGRVRPGGGFLLHAAVNTDVISGGGNEALVVGLAGVFGAIGKRVHPMAGLDFWLDEVGDDVEVNPTVTLGALMRLGKVSVRAGADLGQGRPHLGLGYSFR